MNRYVVEKEKWSGSCAVEKVQLETQQQIRTGYWQRWGEGVCWGEGWGVGEGRTGESGFDM